MDSWDHQAGSLESGWKVQDPPSLGMSRGWMSQRAAWSPRLLEQEPLHPRSPLACGVCVCGTSGLAEAGREDSGSLPPVSPRVLGWRWGPGRPRGSSWALEHRALPGEAATGAQPPPASSGLPLMGPGDVTLWSREVLVLAGHAAHPRRPRLHNCEVSAYLGCRLSARPEMACVGRTSLPPLSLPGLRWGL